MGKRSVERGLCKLALVDVKVVLNVSAHGTRMSNGH